MDDFNSHSPSWGYDDLDHKGDEVEDWIITHNMVLINKADDPKLSTPELGEQRAVQIWPSLPMIMSSLNRFPLLVALDEIKLTGRQILASFLGFLTPRMIL